MSFTKDFVWGAASASYQIEGAAFEDGRGLSVWDVFCKKDGAVFNKEHGNTACDHYHLFRQDIALMKDLGIKAYRFSIAWPRIFPDGKGAINQKGVDFYNQLIDELLKNSIEPFITLFHWDYPYSLYEQGGWLNPSSPSWFADYASFVTEKYSDRVTYWTTYNEPQCFVDLGHSIGVHAPGIKVGPKELATIGHNAILGHGMAVAAIRSAANRDVQVGLVLALNGRCPIDRDPGTVEAVRKDYFTMKDHHTWAAHYWLDPTIKGAYSQDAVNLFGEYLPKNYESDIQKYASNLDFIGVNLYYADPCTVGNDGNSKVVPFTPGYPRAVAYRWPVTPEGLYWIPKFIYERYNIPLYITENGMANADWVSVDGKVHDPQRIDFVTRYLSCVKQAIKDGVDIRGYFYWSIFDNFEWSEGYKERFGMVYVDFLNFNRIPKDSAYWYSEVIKSNGSEIPSSPATFKPW